MSGAGARRRVRSRAGALLALVALAALVAPALPSHVAPSSTLATPSAPAAAVPADLSGSWSTFHGSENRSGFSATDGPEVGTVLWTVAPPRATAFPIRAGLAVDAESVYASDDLGTLYAFNRTANGSLDWQNNLGGTLTAADRWGPELVVAGSSGSVSAVWASNGTQRWAVTTDGGIPQGVAATGGIVYVGTTNGSVYALNATTGGRMWQAHVGGAVAGAVAVEGATLVATTTNGTVVALTTSGAPLWTARAGAAVATAAAVSNGRVLVADTSGNVTSWWLANGTEDWRWVGRTTSPGDAFESTPAVGLGRVYVSSQLGVVTALSLSNGSAAWRFVTPYAGYPVLSSPALTPNGLYVDDANLDIVDLVPTTGALVWSTQDGFVPAYPAPAVDGGILYVGNDLGSLLAIGGAQGPPAYSVSGTVIDPNGTPVAGAFLATTHASALTNGTGAFSLLLPNGSYVLNTTKNGFLATDTDVVVAGPVANLRIVLVPVPVVRVTGFVVNARSQLPVPNATVILQGAGLVRTTVSGPDGSFSIAAAVGDDYLTVSPPSGYESLQEHLHVPAAGLSGVVVAIVPVEPVTDLWTIVGAVVAMFLALAVVGLWEASRRRARLGQPTRLFSPFAQYVTMRILLLPAQVVAILAILFVFGTILPAAFFEVSPCTISSWACAPGGWDNPFNPPLAFLGGFWSFIVDMFTGQWGSTQYGNLVEPAKQILAWWLPNSIQLALFALPISAAVAYVVGLYVGAHPDGAADLGARLTSTVGLLTPTFLIALLLLGVLYEPFFHRVGDIPYGLLPSVNWFGDHGGIPAWVGIADNTSPTTLPVIDGILHGDWPFVEIVFLKTLWQALIIALVYVAIFLRFARHAVAEASQEPHVLAARARGVSDATILWRHTGRRVIPLFLLVFGLTLPIYLGTQAVVEALANDPGIGTLLISQMTHVTQNGFGFHQLFPAQHPGSLYQVTIFGLVILVLLGNLFADVLARYLDPRLLRTRR